MKKESEIISPKKHAGGRPKENDVDVVRLEKLARIGCTYAEIADVLGVSKEVLEKSYSTFYTKGRENLKERLRKRQISKALGGNVVMLIWLGKQYLDQKDRSELELGVPHAKTLTIKFDGE